MENVDFHTKKPVGLLASLPQISHFARSKHLREHLSYDSSLLSLHPRSNFIELSHIWLTILCIPAPAHVKDAQLLANK